MIISRVVIAFLLERDSDMEFSNTYSSYLNSILSPKIRHVDCIQINLKLKLFI